MFKNILFRKAKDAMTPPKPELGRVTPVGRLVGLSTRD